MTESGAIDRPMEDPLAEIERQLISAYVAGAGEDLHELLTRHDEASRKLLAQAARFAAERLAEIEARSHYVRSLHGAL